MRYSPITLKKEEKKTFLFVIAGLNIERKLNSPIVNKGTMDYVKNKKLFISVFFSLTFSNFEID